MHLPRRRSIDQSIDWPPLMESRTNELRIIWITMGLFYYIDCTTQYGQKRFLTFQRGTMEVFAPYRFNSTLWENVRARRTFNHLSPKKCTGDYRGDDKTYFHTHAHGDAPGVHTMPLSSFQTKQNENPKNDLTQQTTRTSYTVRKFIYIYTHI